MVFNLRKPDPDRNNIRAAQNREMVVSPIAQMWSGERDRERGSSDKHILMSGPQHGGWARLPWRARPPGPQRHRCLWPRRGALRALGGLQRGVTGSDKWGWRAFRGVERVLAESSGTG